MLSSPQRGYRALGDLADPADFLPQFDQLIRPRPRLFATPLAQQSASRRVIHFVHGLDGLRLEIGITALAPPSDTLAVDPVMLVLALLPGNLVDYLVGVQRGYSLGDLKRERPRRDQVPVFREADRVAAQLSGRKPAEPRKAVNVADAQVGVSPIQDSVLVTHQQLEDGARRTCFRRILIRRERQNSGPSRLPGTESLSIRPQYFQPCGRNPFLVPLPRGILEPHQHPGRLLSPEP